MSNIIVSWFQPVLMADNSGQWCANCLTIISWAKKGRKENIYYSLHCAQTLHFNMVKVNVASTRTPWLNQHLPLYQQCDPAPTRLQCTWYWKLEPFSDLAVNEKQLSYQDVFLVTDHVNSPTVKNSSISQLRIQLFDTFCETKEIISQRPWTTDFLIYKKINTEQR
jgi:hypothetical protein